jgi:site-specific DNA-methyltransferase (adenine-specific)
MIEIDQIYNEDCLEGMKRIDDASVDCVVTSPPYFVDKEYEHGTTYDEWQSLLQDFIAQSARVLKPGGFMVINIADILTFKDEQMPRFMANNPANRKSDVTREMVLEAKTKHPEYNRDQLALFLGCSEQTIDRRLNGNNARGQRPVSTRVKLVGGSLEQYAYAVGLYLYDKRIWQKDPAWANSKWTTSTLKAVSESEDIYVYWKAGEYTVNRERLTPREWKEWGLRQIWQIPSVRRNDIHPAMFPEALVQRIIRLYTDAGQTVLDPFLGSGTTCVAALREHRHFLGFELNKEYFDIAQRRIALERSQPTLDFNND